MSVQPAVGLGSIGTAQGTAEIIADIQRQLRLFNGQRTLIGDGSITGTKVANGTITGGNLVTGTITTEYIAAGAIQAGNIAADAIQATHLSAGSVVAGKIAANAVTAGTIAAGAVQAGTIDVGAVTAGTIAANAVTATNIASISLTTIQAAVTTLSAITSNLGSITAGTIQGATIQTSSSGSRVVINSSGLTGYASDGTTQVFNINTGTGIATFTGVANVTGGSIVPSAIPAIGGGNQIVNSSFEDQISTLGTNWSLYNNGLSPAPTLSVVSLAPQGSKHETYAVRLINGTDTVGDMGVVTALSVAPKVKGNTKYTLSAYGISGNTTANFQVIIAWYDSSDGFINSVATSTTSVGTSAWTRMSGTFTSPSNAAKAACYAVVINPASGQIFYVDAMQFEEGEVPTAYRPKITELLPGAIQTIHLAAGAVTTNTLAAGAVTAQKLTLSHQSANMLPNARFSYYTGSLGDPGMSQATSPGYWQNYDNGGAGTATWSKVLAGGPTGENSWKVIVSGATATKGYMTLNTVPFKLGQTFVTSLWWKSDKYPSQAANASFLYELITYPAPSSSTWQYYSWRVIPTTDGGRDASGAVVAGGGYDWFYIYASDTGMQGAASATHTSEITMPQWERGDYPSPFAPKSDELLPYSVGNTVLGPDSVTTDKILATTIQAGDIATSQINATHISGINLSVIQAAVTTLSAITADIGTVTAGTIRGPIIETSASNPKVRMDSTDGFFVTDASGNKVSQLKAGAGGLDVAAATGATAPEERKIRF